MTDIPTIDALPATPQRGQDADVFIQRADAFIDALPLFRAQLNAVAVALAGLGAIAFNATSTSSVTVGTGAKTFVTADRAAFVTGQPIVISKTTDATVQMRGTVTSYDSATYQLVVNVLETSGAGTNASWAIGLLPAGSIAAALATLGSIAYLAKATSAEYLAATASRALAAAEVWAAAAFVALTDASTIALDMSAFINGYVVLAGNRTLGAPTGAKAGQSGVIEIKQDATGSRTLAYASVWKFGSSTPSLSTAANARDLLYYEVLRNGDIDAYLSKAR